MATLYSILLFFGIISSGHSGTVTISKSAADSLRSSREYSDYLTAGGEDKLYTNSPAVDVIVTANQ